MTQILTGRDIGQAHYATRAVLERVLTDLGLEFPHSVALNLLGGNDFALASDDLRARLENGLKLGEVEVMAVIDGLVSRGLVVLRLENDGRTMVSVTPTGVERFNEVQSRTARFTTRLYAGLPPEDQETTKRLLATLTARANAELAG